MRGRILGCDKNRNVSSETFQKNQQMNFLNSPIALFTLHYDGYAVAIRAIGTPNCWPNC
jgi:hypothetical protein